MANIIQKHVMRHWLWYLAVAIGALALAALLWPRGDLYGQDFSSRLVTYQSLVGSILALYAGALAYLGLLHQIKSTEAQHKLTLDSEDLSRKTTASQHAELLKIERDNRLHAQTARSATIAQQMYHACESVLVFAREVHNRITDGDEDGTNKRAHLEEMHSHLLIEMRNAIDRFDEAIRWARDPLLQVPAKSQENLTKQISAGFSSVRNIERVWVEMGGRNALAGGPINLVWPSRPAKRTLAEGIAELRDARDVFKLITRDHGRTQGAVVATMAIAQDIPSELEEDHSSSPSSSVRG